MCLEMEQKTGRIFFFFVLCELCFCSVLFAEKSVLSSRKRSRRPSFVSRRKIKLNMTARITYKRRYVLDALGFFLFIFARRGKRWMRRERVSERSSFACMRVGYICG